MRFDLRFGVFILGFAVQVWYWDSGEIKRLNFALRLVLEICPSVIAVTTNILMVFTITTRLPWATCELCCSHKCSCIVDKHLSYCDMKAFQTINLSTSNIRHLNFLFLFTSPTCTPQARANNRQCTEADSRSIREFRSFYKLYFIPTNFHTNTGRTVCCTVSWYFNTFSLSMSQVPQTRFLYVHGELVQQRFVSTPSRSPAIHHHTQHEWNRIAEETYKEPLQKQLRRTIKLAQRSDQR